MIQHGKEIDNKLDKSERLQVIVVSIIVTLGILAGIIIAVPIQEHNTITYVSWTWDVPIYKYTKHNENSWNKPPKDAYDIDKKREYRRTVTKKDSKGNTHTESVYDTKYYYSINKWDFAYNISSTGIDKKPYESSGGDLPYTVDNPSLGDIKRGNHTEKYECNINGTVFEISKADWERVEKGCEITYKRHRFSKKIYDIRFGNQLEA